MQIAPVAEQSVVVSTVSPTASIPSRSTLLSQRQRVPDSSRLARITSRYVTAMMRASASLKTHSPVNAAVSGAPSGCALTVNDGRLVCSIRLCRWLALSRRFYRFERRFGTQCRTARLKAARTAAPCAYSVR